jgi:hypothetical protein
MRRYDFALEWAGRLLRPLPLGLAVVFVVTAYAGANIVAFEQLEGRLGGEEVGSSTDAVGAVSSWKNTPGIAARARSLLLDITLAKTPGNTAAINDALREFAEGSPTSVAAWQALVAFGDITGAPKESVLAAFRMSALTGSHEGYFIVQRALFGLNHWAELPERDRVTIVRDVLKTIRSSDFNPGPSYSAIIAKKSAAERDEIRAALTVSGLADREVLQALAL